MRESDADLGLIIRGGGSRVDDAQDELHARHPHLANLWATYEDLSRQDYEAALAEAEADPAITPVDAIGVAMFSDLLPDTAVALRAYQEAFVAVVGPDELAEDHAVSHDRAAAWLETYQKALDDTTGS
jgi:hypothetical protein